MLGVAIAILGLGVLLIYAAVTDQDVIGIARNVLSGG